MPRGDIMLATVVAPHSSGVPRGMASLTYKSTSSSTAWRWAIGGYEGELAAAHGKNGRGQTHRLGTNRLHQLR